MKKIILFMILGLVTACAPSNEEVLSTTDVDVLYVDPSLKKLSVNTEGISIFAKVLDESEQKQMFNANLTNRGIEPVLVSLFNNNRAKILVKGFSAKLICEIGKIKQLKSEDVVNQILKDQSTPIWLNNPTRDMVENFYQQREEAIRTGFLNKVNGVTTVFPRQGTSWIMFFDKEDVKNSSHKLSLAVQSMNNVDYLYFSVPIEGYYSEKQEKQKLETSDIEMKQIENKTVSNSDKKQEKRFYRGKYWYTDMN